MTIEIDPGTDGSEVKEGSTIPLAQTAAERPAGPDPRHARTATPAPISSSCSRRRAQGLRGDNGPKLAAGLKRFEPTARDLAKINGALAERRQNISRVITNFGRVSQELGHSDTQLAGFVRSSNDVLGSFARQEASIRADAPGAARRRCARRRARCESGNRFALQLGPASRRLIPAAQALGPALRQTRPLFREDRRADPAPDPALHARGPASRFRHLEAGRQAAARRPPPG